jgi:putative acetyltransferase
MQIISAESPEQVAMIRTLFEEYAAFLAVDLCFQGFTEELNGLPGRYAPPSGALRLAMYDGQAAGCVAIRGLSADSCEMKRLYVRPAYRGMGIGRELTREIIVTARRIGYRVMRLDTLERLIEAMTLYRSFGFNITSPYYTNPLENVVYWELTLDDVPSA